MRGVTPSCTSISSSTACTRNRGSLSTNQRSASCTARTCLNKLAKSVEEKPPALQTSNINHSRVISIKGAGVKEEDAEQHDEVDTNTMIELNYYKGKRAFRRLSSKLFDGVRSVIGFNEDAPQTDLEYIDKEYEMEEHRKQEKHKKDNIDLLSEGLYAIKNTTSELPTIPGRAPTKLERQEEGAYNTTTATGKHNARNYK